MKNTIATSLFIRQLELNVNLGWTDEERSQKQTITIDIKIRFKKPPKACTTDNLADTFCYDTLIKEINNYVDPREFRLIEHLGHEVYQLAKNNVKNEALISIIVNKKPAWIENLKGGASFYFGEE